MDPTTASGRARKLMLALTTLFAVGLLAVLGQLQATTPPQQTAGTSQQLAGRQPQDLNNMLSLAEPGESIYSEEQDFLEMSEYWTDRVSYPTGRFDRKWVNESFEYDRAFIKEAIPGGRVTYNAREASQSPLAMNPAQWTFIGPQPQQTDGCSVCFAFHEVAGRVNDIIIHPVTNTTIFVASDGGGVWKSTNCCSPATTFTPKTDSPLLSTVAIGDLEIDPINPSVLYAGTGDLRFGSFSFGSAGLLKSTDVGETWTIKGADVFGPYFPQAAGQFPQYQSIGKVEVDPNANNKVVVGTKTGLYLSYDAGETWTGPCLTNPYTTQRQDITALILRKMNASTTQIIAAVGVRGYSTTVQHNLHLNGANGIYRTTMPASGCPTGWTLISRGDNGWPLGSGTGIPVNETVMTGTNILGRIDMAMAPSDNNTLYAQVQSIIPNYNGSAVRGGQLGIWQSTNNGETWTRRSTGQTLNAAVVTSCPGVSVVLGGDYPQNWYDQNITVDPAISSTIFFQTVDLWRSPDGGGTVNNVTCGYQTITVPAPKGVHVDHHAAALFPRLNPLAPLSGLFGSDGGVYYTADGANTFINLNRTLGTIEFYSGDITGNFATDPAPAAAAGAQDNGSSVWTGQPGVGPLLWQMRLGGDGMFARFDPITKECYMESQNANLNYMDNLCTGPGVPVAGPWSGDRLSFIFPYEVFKGTPGDPANDCALAGCDHMIAGTMRVWETTTGALPPGSWVPVSGDLTKGTLADRSFINQLAYAPSISTTAIVGTNDGNVQYGFGLGKGTMANWVNVTNNNTVLPNRPILDVAISPANPLVGYAGVGGFDQNTPSTPGHVFMVTCTANCASFFWRNVSGNLPNVPVDSIIANPRFPQQVFAGTDWGVYFTNDVNHPTPHWSRFNAGMPNVMIWDMAIDRGATTLAAFTRSRGAYVWPLPSAYFQGSPSPTATGVQPTLTSIPTSVPPTRTPTALPSNTPLPSPTACALTTAENGTPMATLDNGVPITSTITVAGSTSNIAYVQVFGINIAHTYASDLHFKLVGPDGTTVQLFNDICGTEVWAPGDANFNLDDGAAVPIGLVCPPGTGTYKPEQPLSAFAGKNANGVWSLVITDDGPGDTGTLNHWGLRIASASCITGTPTSTPVGNTPTRTATAVATGTSVLPTVIPATLTPEPTAPPSVTGTRAATNTPQPTQTPGGPPATATLTRAATITPQPTRTATRTATPGGVTSTPVATRTPCNISFSDVRPADYFYEGVRYLTCAGAISGYNDNTFRPYNEATRAQLVKIVVIAEGFAIITPGTATFNDVPTTHPFYSWIETAAARQIISGYTDGSFRPYNQVTRGQITKIIVVAEDWELVDPVTPTFVDVPPGNPFYVFIETAVRKGVISGYEDRTFRWYNNATRGQIAKIVHLAVTQP